MADAFASVILDVSIDKTLDYRIPQEYVHLARKGMRVAVPLRNKTALGYIFSIKEASDFHSVKPITQFISEQELIPDKLFELGLWMAKYYCTPLRKILKIMLPASIRSNMPPKQQLFVTRQKTCEELRELCVSIRNKAPAQANVLDVMITITKGILLSELLEKTKGSRAAVDLLVKKGCLNLEKISIDRSPIAAMPYFPTKPKQLNEDQSVALKRIQSTLESNHFETHLLFGVTGSGKTEVYLQAIDSALKLNKGAIILVPEIALTAQTIERFRSRFEGHIAVLHHRLSPGERCDEWNRIRRGEAKIVIGARSAVFSPVCNLGLIIVDEEHENSYKQQDEMPCYHARDIAVMRGKMEQCAVLLGSATPSLESYYNATKGKYLLSKLSCRPGAASIPQVTIVDMKKEFEKAQGFTTFSESLIAGIKKRFSLGEQTILFLNRRGYHTTLFCLECRQSLRCLHCDASLTFHRSESCLSCHLCGYQLSPPPKQCPLCHSLNPMKYRGIGTEQVEKAIHAILPEVRTLRMDADTTKHKGSHHQLYRSFATGKADVLIGTQMVAKGLHFPQVTLVGILNCDSGLNIPDFRASESVFQLMTQVAGRAGRGSIPGEVIVQTHMPENQTIQLAAKQDFETFFTEEMSVREFFHYPPFNQLIKLMFSGEDSQVTFQTGEKVRSLLLESLPNTYEVHPLLPCGYAKVKDSYRFQFLVKGPSAVGFNHIIESVHSRGILSKSVRMRIDVNPLSTFF